MWYLPLLAVFLLSACASQEQTPSPPPSKQEVQKQIPAAVEATKEQVEMENEEGMVEDGEKGEGEAIE